MALFRESIVRDYAQRALAADRTKRRTSYLRKSQDLLFESVTAASLTETYDMFLSHNFRDADIVLGMKEIFAEMGYKTYVDWIEDPQLNRKNVDKATASKLKERMQKSKSLFFVTTENSTDSKWMPWECGYFDGIKTKVAIVPVVRYSSNEKYLGQEYLGLYPYCKKMQSKGGKELLYIFEDDRRYLPYDNWVKHEGSMEWWQL